MKCILCGEFMAFLRGLVVTQVYKVATGAMHHGTIPLTAIATGQEIPTNKGWQRIAQARADSKPRQHQRPRKRH